jgi:hypothetical protein
MQILWVIAKLFFLLSLAAATAPDGLASMVRLG